MKTIGIIGSRSRDTEADFHTVYDAFRLIFEEGDRIVSGGCPKGGDRFADRIAKVRGLTIITHYPDWARFGIQAGFARNTNIVRDADVLIACIPTSGSQGTQDTIDKFRRMKPGAEVIIV